MESLVAAPNGLITGPWTFSCHLGGTGKVYAAFLLPASMLVAGELPPPPIGVLMNFRIGELSEGRAVFVVEPAEYHYNPIGIVHGGLAATLLDSAMGCAVHSTLPAGASYTTLEIKVNYIRPMSAETGLVRCEANIIHVGGRTATAEGKIVDQKGKRYAHSTTTCIIFRQAP